MRDINIAKFQKYLYEIGGVAIIGAGAYRHEFSTIVAGVMTYGIGKFVSELIDQAKIKITIDKLNQLEKKLSQGDRIEKC